ncbi:MAG: hypothetical protein WEA56_06945 [Balneolaceae bacterium]
MYFSKRFFPLLVLVVLSVSCQQELQQPSFEYVTGNPADSGTRYPNLYQDDTGTTFMSWFLKIDETIYAVQYSAYINGAWTEPQAMNISQDYFVNWADFPSVVGMNGEVVAGHWLKKINGGTYAYNVNIAFPGEQPRRWTESVTPHTDGTPTEHGFVSLEPIDEETVLAIWLDGRNTDGRDHSDYSNMDQAMTLRSAEISRSGEISRERVIDSAVCDCCQTDLVRTEGGFIVVYRNRTEGETRDIYSARYDPENGEWSEPAAVSDDGWEIMACPVNGPRIAVNGNQVAAAWFTMADDEPKVLMAVSEDGGRTFGEAVQVAGETSIGRVDITAGDEKSFFVSWMQQREENGYIMLREIKTNEGPAQPVRVGMTSSSRSSGFPRMVTTDQGVLLAWTQTEPIYRIRTALVPVE